MHLRLRRGFSGRHHDRETGALAGLAEDLDAAAVMGDNLLHDGKADPGAGFARRLCLPRAIELGKDLAEFLPAHSIALVPHRDTQTSIVAVTGYGNFRVGWGVLHSVGKQVVESVLDQLPVAGHPVGAERLEPDADAFAIGLCTDPLDAAGQHHHDESSQHHRPVGGGLPSKTHRARFPHARSGVARAGHTRCGAARVPARRRSGHQDRV